VSRFACYSSATIGVLLLASLPMLNLMPDFVRLFHAQHLKKSLPL
jgi:hypothetical protein